MPNQIHLVGDFLEDEAIANAAVYPGHLVEMMSTGYVRVHSTQGGFAERMLAIEDALQGRLASTAYAAAERVTFVRPVPGAKSQFMLLAGENVAKGDKLISNGNGCVIASGSEASGVTVSQIIAVADEALDLSASGAVDTLIAGRWM